MHRGQSGYALELDTLIRIDIRKSDRRHGAAAPEELTRRRRLRLRRSNIRVRAPGALAGARHTEQYPCPRAGRPGRAAYGPHNRVPIRLYLGVSQSFAKFREKIARSAAGAEIFRNLPLTAPLASQAHAVHMYRIIIERYIVWPPVTRWTSQTVPDLKLSRHLRNFGPAPHTPAAPRAARRARSSGPTLVPTPQPRRTHAGSTQAGACSSHF